jgi:hypothetical protein
MTWVRLDDSSPLHPKHQRAGLEAFAWWTAALCYCNRFLTDGHIAAKDLPHVWQGLHPAKLKAIIDRLLEQHSLESAPDGVLIHDYLDYQPSRETALMHHQSKADAGRLGGLMSGQSRRANTQQHREPAKQNGDSASSRDEASASSNAKQTLEADEAHPSIPSIHPSDQGIASPSSDNNGHREIEDEERRHYGRPLTLLERKGRQALPERLPGGAA